MLNITNFFQYPGTWKTKEEARKEVLTDVIPEKNTGLTSLIPYDVSKVELSFKNPDPNQFQEEVINELATNEEWALNEDLLTDHETECWLVSDTEPTLEGGLAFFHEASAVDNQAQTHALKAAQLRSEAEVLHKRGLEVMVAASVKPISLASSAAATDLQASSSDSGTPSPNLTIHQRRRSKGHQSLFLWILPLIC